MDFNYPFQEEADLVAFSSRLSNDFETLALRFATAAQDDTTICIDLHWIFIQCLILDEKRAVFARSYPLCYSAHGSYYISPFSRDFTMARFGKYFKEFTDLIGPQRGAWNIRMTSKCWRHLRVHNFNFEEHQHHRRERGEKHVLEYKLEYLAIDLSVLLSHQIDFELILTDHVAMKSLHVLWLYTDRNKDLSTAEALDGPGGAIYIRRYQHGLSHLARTRDPFLESTEEPEAAAMQVIEDGGRWDHLQDVPLGFSASARTVAPIPLGVVSDNEAVSIHGLLQDQSSNTRKDASDRQLRLTDRYAAVAVNPIEAPEIFDADVDMYGFTQIIPSASINAVAQGLLPYESRDWAAPVSMTSPEADSPWSETDGVPPPYALSPGVYHLRLEAATRPSPPSG